MHLHKLILAGVVALVLVGPVLADEGDGEKYLCIGDRVAALRWEKSVGEWRLQTGTNETKYILKPTAGDKSVGTPYAVFPFGSRTPKVPDFRCSESVRDVMKASLPKYQFMICGGGVSEFAFSPNTMRFQITYSFGYVQDSKEDTPYIMIGTCSEL